MVHINDNFYADILCSQLLVLNLKNVRIIKSSNNHNKYLHMADCYKFCKLTHSEIRMLGTTNLKLPLCIKKLKGDYLGKILLCIITYITLST